MQRVAPLIRFGPGLLSAALLIALAGACTHGMPAGWLPRPVPIAPSPERVRLDPAPGSQAECFPTFPDSDGWLGGDAAYSIPLPPRAPAARGAAMPGENESEAAAHAEPGSGPDHDGESGRTLWLFGDSFIEQPGSPRGQRTYPFVHNSIALSRCAPNGDFSVEYFFGRDAAGKPSDFIAPDPDAPWFRRMHDAAPPDPSGDAESAPYYWLFDAFFAERSLYIGLLRVGPAPPRGEFRLPFRLYGVDLARVTNPDASPPEWRIQRIPLSDHPTLFPASSFSVLGKFLYAFAFIERGDGRSPRTLTRLPLSALSGPAPDPRAALEVRTAAGDWQPLGGTLTASPRVLMNDNATEMSVDFDHAAQRWTAVYSRLPSVNDRNGAQSAVQSGKIWRRTAARIEGPWSEPEALFQVPEVALSSDRTTTERNAPPGQAAHRKANHSEKAVETVCYAGKAHPQFSGPGRILVTYVCNLFARTDLGALEALQRLTKQDSIYRPRAVSLPTPGTRAPNRER